MMTRNVGTTDRALRIFLGLALIAGFFLNAQAGWRWLYLVGIAIFVTGLVGRCPLYRLLGISTRMGD